jgi:N6-adenosine-specific RNA methylase IME4
VERSDLPWPTGTYDVVLADPPWTYSGQPDKWGAAARQYRCQSDDWIKALPIADLLDRRGVIFCWATCPLLDVAISAIEAWGLAFRGVAFVWVKTRRSDPSVPIGAQGVRPSIVKPTSELVLAASNVRKGRPLPLADEGVSQIVLAPKGAHSEKPDDVQARIERLYPETRRIELFARRRRPGWDAWGDELPVPTTSGVNPARPGEPADDRPSCPPAACG